MNKKNLILLGVLIAAIAITYFFEERANINNEKQKIIETSLLNADSLGDLKQVVGIKLNIEKRGPLYYDKNNNLRMNPNRLDEFFKILSGLKVISTLNQAEVSKVGLNFYIPDPTMKLAFKFEKGEMVFTLGKKLDYDQSFYMKVDKGQDSQVVLVRDDSPDPGTYENEDAYKKSDAKYKRLQVVFYLTNKYFQDTSVFRDFAYKVDGINFEKINISTFRNKRFSLSFAESTTNPAVPESLGYFDENWVSFHQALSKLEGKSLYFPADNKLLDEVLSQFEVVDREKRKYSLELYKKYGAENGYFLKTSFNNIIYQISPEDAQYFFVNVQDFWQKKWSPITKVFDLSLSFFNGKSLKVKIEDQELFKVLPETNLRPLEFKRIIEFFKSEGNHVSEMTEKPTEILKKNMLRVQFENKSLNVILEDNEVIIVDIAKKIKIHHYVGAKLPFSVNYADYIKATGP